MATGEARRAVVSVFGLSGDELRPVVEAAVGEAVLSFTVSIEHEVTGYYGMAGEKLIPTFAYVATAGREGRVTVFAKHSHNPNSPEPEHYHFLASHDVPLPRVYGVLRSPEGRPVQFLECLETADAWHPTEYHDAEGRACVVLPAEERLEYLSLFARFNAIRPSPEYMAWLKSRSAGSPPEHSANGQIVETVWEQACRGEVGGALRAFCAEHTSQRARLRAVAERAAAQVADMPIGLVHGDLSTENTGRRPNGERAILDVENVGLGVRFSDIAGLLGRPEERWPKPPGSYPTPEVLAEHYLSEYARWGGDAPPVDAFLVEVRTLWLSATIFALGHSLWLCRSDATTDEATQRGLQSDLLRDLQLLLARYC